MSKTYFDKIPRSKILSVKKKDLDSAFKKIQKDWEKYLKSEGIRLPKEDTAKYYQLTILKHFEGKAIHKDDISALIQRFIKNAANDQQIRHLKTQDGWFILNRGDSAFVTSVEKFNPESCHTLLTTKSAFPNSNLVRRKAIKQSDWKLILEKYNYTCASCGTKIGEFHRFDSSFKVETLEKGHMNPNKPLEVGNVIPQCRWCNRIARGDFTFDEQGRPRAVANVRPVRRAEDKVKDEIADWIQKKYNKKSK